MLNKYAFEEIIEIIISYFDGQFCMQLGYPRLRILMHNNMNQSAKMLNANVKRRMCENDIIPNGTNFQGMNIPLQQKVFENVLF